MSDEKLKLIIFSNAILKTKLKPVEKITKEVLDTLDAMLDIMYEENGIGLAANQVNFKGRIIVVDIRNNPDGNEDDEISTRNPIKLINPEIIFKSDEMAVFEEGCLSLPDIVAEVDRPARVKVQYLDVDGNKQVIDAKGLMAVCLQHEIDHLDGILFTDRISKIRKDVLLRKFLKTQRESKIKEKNNNE